MTALALQRSESLAALAAAKAKAQAKFLPIGRDKNATVALKSGGSYSYAYADLASCLDAVVPALSEVGIALFQPVRIEDGAAVATTLLVHGDSGEWIASDYAVVISDPRDARSVGSAATYARRYGLLAMLGIASADEDDDGKDARGGDHEIASRPASTINRPVLQPHTHPADGRAPVCPACGKDTLRPSKFEDGGWYCDKRLGCGKSYKKLPDQRAAVTADQTAADDPVPF